MDVLCLWYLSLKIISVLVLRVSTFSMVLFFIFLTGICVSLDCLLKMVVLWLGGICISVERVCKLWLRILFWGFLSRRSSSHTIAWYIFCVLYYVGVYCITMFWYILRCRINGPFTEYWFGDWDADWLQLVLWIWDTCIWLSRAVYILVLCWVVYCIWLGALFFGRFVSIDLTVDTSFNALCFDYDSSLSLVFVVLEDLIFTNDWDCCSFFLDLGWMLRDKSDWLLIGSVNGTSWYFVLLVIERGEVISVQ